MRFTIIVLCIISLNGCAGLKLGDPERWTTDKVFYSNKLPSLKLTVNEHTLKFSHMQDIDGLADSVRGDKRTGINVTRYFFKGTGKQIRIKVETLTGQNWYMVKPTYTDQKTWGINFLSSTQEIKDKTYNTAVLCDEVSGKSYMVKAYGAVFGETVRFNIFYMEVVSREWLQKSPNFLSSKDHDFISNFIKRADSSFSISPISDTDYQSKTEMLKGQFLEDTEDRMSGVLAVEATPGLYKCFKKSKLQATGELNALFISQTKNSSETLPEIVGPREMAAFETGVTKLVMQKYITENYNLFNEDNGKSCSAFRGELEHFFVNAKASQLKNN